MHTSTNQNSALKIFQQIGRSIRQSQDPDEMLRSAVEALGWHFNLDRCCALIIDGQQHELAVKAEYVREAEKPVGEKRYQLMSNSEIYRLLSEGRPVPLTQIQSEV